MTLKQKLFIDCYLKYGNATQAAMQVYNTRKRNVAGQIGYENLKKHDIQTAIEAYLKLANPNPKDMAEAFVDVLVNGTTRQKLDASITYFKIMGLYPS